MDKDIELTATLKSPISTDVEFQDIYYEVNVKKHLIKETIKRNILCGVSGVFRNNQITAIMGPSGAGKSSLLNAISGFRTSGVKGFIKINRKDSCYITQEDNHQTLLTVEELMAASCALKLKSKSSHATIIQEILENLNLNHCRKTTSDYLSGGERKRLSIALELVANPKVFFLDEPTSGLDEVTAAQCCRLLKVLSQQGRTIVCTIHQPSGPIFNLFDSVFVMAKGKCVYQGAPSKIIPFLKEIQIECPKTYSPSDFIIEICDSDDGALIPKLSELTQNGKLIYCDITDNDVINSGFQNAISTLFLDQPKEYAFGGGCGVNMNGRTSVYNCLNSSTALFKRMKAITKRMRSTDHPTSSFKQFWVLFNLMMLRITRNRIALWIQLIHHTMCGIFFGLIFYNSANEGERMFDHLKYCIGCILVICYTQVMVPVLSYPAEVKLVKKEFFNRWYNLTPYYLAMTCSRLPLQIFFNMIFLTITYWMAGLPNQLWRFMLFSAIGIITSFVAEGMGLFIGATFRITNGAIVGPLLIAPFLGLAVYGFDFAASIPTFINILMKFSYIRVAAVGLVLTVFGFGREELDCNDIYCHFGDPKVLLRFLQIENVTVWMQFGYLTILLVFFRTLLFISLRKRCRT